MHRPTLHWRRLGLPVLATTLATAIILAGSLLYFEPYLTNAGQPVVGVPAPPALNAITKFAVPPNQQACMHAVAITPNADLAQFELQPAKPTTHGGTLVELVLSASGYSAAARMPSGYLGRIVTLRITPPKHALIGMACFVNRGTTTALLNGTIEPSTVTRSEMLVDGISVVGDIGLRFLASHPQSLLGRLGEIFGHVSNLTDRLVPVWLIWILAVLVAFGVPVGMVASFYWALREDTATMRG